MAMKGLPMAMVGLTFIALGVFTPQLAQYQYLILLLFAFTTMAIWFRDKPLERDNDLNMIGTWIAFGGAALMTAVWFAGSIAVGGLVLQPSTSIPIGLLILILSAIASMKD